MRTHVLGKCKVILSNDRAGVAGPKSEQNVKLNSDIVAPSHFGA